MVSGPAVSRGRDAQRLAGRRLPFGRAPEGGMMGDQPWAIFGGEMLEIGAGLLHQLRRVVDGHADATREVADEMHAIVAAEVVGRLRARLPLRDGGHDAVILLV